MKRLSRLRRSALALTLSILATACPFGSKAFGQELRVILLASPPFVESLPLSTSLKKGLVTDFTDMADHTAGLSECLSDAADKPAKLVCVQTLEGQVETIINRGNFGNANNQRLQQILGLIRGIIASARIYYGGGSSGRSAVSERVTEESIKKQIKELKEAMKP